MNVNMNNVQIKDSAYAAVGAQLLNDAQKTGLDVKNQIESLREEIINRVSKQITNKLDEIGSTVENMLGEEASIEDINSYISKSKEDINIALDVSEMDANSRIAELSTKITALENRTIGSMIKDEVRDAVKDVVNKSRNAVSLFSSKLNKFYKNTRECVGKAIATVKDRAAEVSKAWASIKDSYANSLEVMSQHLEKSDIEKDETASVDEKRAARNKRLDFSIAKQAEAVRDLQGKIVNAKGIEKLIYKASLISEVNNLDSIVYEKTVANQKDEFNDKVSDTKDKVINKGKEIVADLKDKSETFAIHAMYAKDAIQNSPEKAKEIFVKCKDRINKEIDKAKTDISNSAKNIRNNAVTKILDSMDTAINKARDYADNKGMLNQAQTVEQNDIAKADFESEEDIERE